MQAGIEKALARSRGIISDGHEITPTFDIETLEGAYTVLCPLPDAHEVRIARLELVSRFMASKLTTSFVMATELAKPDAVTAVAVTRNTCLAGVQMISRNPVTFGAIEWIEDADQIGDEIPALFPRKSVELSARDVADLEQAIKAFSPDGVQRTR
ncbi:MAG: hypothetical protein AAFS01_05450 [Pseudomonadota bacterium]